MFSDWYFPFMSPDYNFVCIFHLYACYTFQLILPGLMTLMAFDEE
jgi:hypothetical protein